MSSSFQSSTEMISSVIRDLRDQSLQMGSNLISNSKILVISTNVDTRLFNQWSFRVLNLPASRLEEYETTEPIEKLVRKMWPALPVLIWPILCDSKNPFYSFSGYGSCLVCWVKLKWTIFWSGKYCLVAKEAHCFVYCYLLILFLMKLFHIQASMGSLHHRFLSLEYLIPEGMKIMSPWEGLTLLIEYV